MRVKEKDSNTRQAKALNRDDFFSMSMLLSDKSGRRI